MPLQQWILLNIPTWMIILSMLAIAVGAAVGGVLLVRRVVDIKKFKEHHDIAGPIFSTIGVIYAVMLAFVLVIVSQDFDSAQNNTVQEANYFADIYRDSVGLSEPFRSQFLEANTNYLDAVIKYEWPKMQSTTGGSGAAVAALVCASTVPHARPLSRGETVLLFRLTMWRECAAGLLSFAMWLPVAPGRAALSSPF